MAYIINCLIMWLLQDKLSLSEDEPVGIKEIARFVVFLYAELWFRSAFVADNAPLDVHLLKSLDSYKK